MEKVAHKFKLKPGASPEEYKKRHDEIWLEVSDTIKKAGIHNYSIWNLEDELFEYYEVEDKNHGYRIFADSDVMIKWENFMNDMIDLDLDPDTGQMHELKLMFYHK